MSHILVDPTEDTEESEVKRLKGRLGPIVPDRDHSRLPLLIFNTHHPANLSPTPATKGSERDCVHQVRNDEGQKGLHLTTEGRTSNYRNALSEMSRLGPELAEGTEDGRTPSGAGLGGEVTLSPLWFRGRAGNTKSLQCPPKGGHMGDSGTHVRPSGRRADTRGIDNRGKMKPPECCECCEHHPDNRRALFQDHCCSSIPKDPPQPLGERELLRRTRRGSQILEISIPDLLNPRDRGFNPSSNEDPPDLSQKPGVLLKGARRGNKFPPSPVHDCYQDGPSPRKSPIPTPAGNSALKFRMIPGTVSRHGRSRLTGVGFLSKCLGIRSIPQGDRRGSRGATGRSTFPCAEKVVVGLVTATPKGTGTIAPSKAGSLR